MALHFLGGIVLGVFGKVPLFTRFGNRLNNGRTLDALEFVEFCLQLLGPGGGNRNSLLHIFVLT